MSHTNDEPENTASKERLYPECYGSEKVLILGNQYDIDCLACKLEEDCLEEQFDRQRCRREIDG